MTTTDALAHGLALELLGRGYLVRCYRSSLIYSHCFALHGNVIVETQLRGGRCCLVLSRSIPPMGRTLVRFYELSDPGFLDAWLADVLLNLGPTAAPAWGRALEHRS